METVNTSEPLDMRYPGGKGLAGFQQWLCQQLPPHVYYVEPFAGHCGVFRAKVPALQSVLIDRDSEVITWLHRYLDRCELAINATDDDGRGNRRGQRCSHVEVIQGDGIEYMEREADQPPNPEKLWYCDPPYHPSTRVRLDLYRYEMTDRDHRRFLRAAIRLQCPVVISGYDCDLYNERLSGWEKQTKQVITRGGTMATECIWKNAQSADVQSIGISYDQLGGSFRERERVNRLVKRWRANLERRPKIERMAILLALIAAEQRQGVGDE